MFWLCFCVELPKNRFEHVLLISKKDVRYILTLGKCVLLLKEKMIILKENLDFEIHMDEINISF